VKRILYSQVAGRREGETPVYKFDWWKIVAAALIGAVITWGSWVTRMCGKAEKTEDYVDMQVQVLHNRITGVQIHHEADETRQEDKLFDLQQRWYEDEITDCEDELDQCGG
jgi:hypothetical protein